MRKLGSQENPCRNNYEIDKIIRGMFNCRIYTLNTFEISDENLQQAKARNIVFVGLAGAYWKTPALPKAQAEIINPTNIAEIKVDKDTIVKTLEKAYRKSSELDSIIDLHRLGIRKLDPLIGRKEEIERVIQILSRRTKNNKTI